MQNFVTLCSSDQTYTKYKVFKKGGDYYVTWEHAAGTDVFKVDSEFNMWIKDYKGEVTKVGNGHVFFVQAALKLLASYNNELFEDTEIFRLEEV